MIEHVRAIVDDHVEYDFAVAARYEELRAAGLQVVEAGMTGPWVGSAAPHEVIDALTGEVLWADVVTPEEFDDVWAEYPEWHSADSIYGDPQIGEEATHLTPDPLLPPGFDLKSHDIVTLTAWLKRFNEREL